MYAKEEYLLWRLAYDCIAGNGYRLIHLSGEADEIWLENLSNKQASLIRLVKADEMDNEELQRDLSAASERADQIRRQLFKRRISLLNVYLTEESIQYEKEASVTFGKVDIFIKRGGESVLSAYLPNQSPISQREVYDWQEAYDMKRAVLQLAQAEAREEHKLFNYGKPFFTYILIAIQVVMFILLEMNGGSQNSETLVKFGAKFNPAIIDGEWWRFFTPMFLHIGFLHLAMNTAALYALGTSVEKLFGRTRFLLLYLFSGFMGSLASFLFSGSISAGASGAIFGCFGALLFLGASMPKLFFRTIGMNIIVVIVINLAFGLTVPGIDNYGHIGGLVGGFLAAAILRFPKRQKPALQLAVLVLTAALTAFLLYAGFHSSYAESRPEWKNSWAEEQLSQNNAEKVYRELTSYTESGRGNGLTYYYLAFSELKLDKLDDAEQHFKEVLRREPKLHFAHYYLAVIYDYKGEKAEALKQARKAVQMDGSNREYSELLDRIESGES